MYQYSADHNAVFDSPSWDVSWRADIGAKSNGGISIVGSTAYIDTFGHRVYAIDALSGQEKWHRELPNVLMNTPIVVAGVVIVGTGNARMLQDSPTLWVMGRPHGDAIYGLSARTGEILWRFETVGENMPTGALVAAGNATQFVFSNGDDHIYSLDPATGRLLWSEPVLGANGMASLTALDGLVYGSSTMGASGLFRLQSDEDPAAQWWSRTWSLSPALSGQYTWQSPHGVADASVTIGDDLVFSQGFELDSPRGSAAVKRAAEIGWGNLLNTEATFRTVVSALDRTTGTMVWEHISDPGRNDPLGSAAFTSDAVFADHRVYEPLAFSKTIAAFDARSGRVYWKIHTRYSVKAGPVLKDGLLYFGDSGANLYVVRASNGTIEHVLSFPGPPAKWGFAKSSPVIVGNTLFISADRWLYALRLDDLDHGRLSSEAAPPHMGPHGDWCTFDPPCASTK